MESKVTPEMVARIEVWARGEIMPDEFYVEARRDATAILSEWRARGAALAEALERIAEIEGGKA